MRLRPTFALLLTVPAVALAGCGTEDGSSGADSGASQSGGDPATLVPTTAAAYFDAAVRPEGKLREGLLAAVGKVGRTKDPEATLAALYAKTTEGEDSVDYQRDIEPWIGERSGVFVDSFEADKPKALLIVSTRDEAKAKASVAAALKREEPGAKPGAYQGFTYQKTKGGEVVGMIGTFLVLGDESQFRRAVGASKGTSLAESGAYTRVVAKLPEDRLGTGWVDAKRVVAQALASDPKARKSFEQIRSLVDPAKLQPVGFSLTADGDAVAMDSVTSLKGISPTLAQFMTLAGGNSSPLVGELPANSWAAYGVSDVGKAAGGAYKAAAGALGGTLIAEQLKSAYGIDLQRDVFSWIGDVAVYARGTQQAKLEGAIVIEATNGPKARAALIRLTGLAAQKAPGFKPKAVKLEGADLAYRIADPSLPKPLLAAYGNGRVVIGLGEAATRDGLSAGDKLGDAKAFKQAKDALDEGQTPSFFVDLPQVLTLVDKSGGASSKDYAKAKPYLTTLAALVAGAKRSGDEQRSRAAVTLK